MSILTVLSLFLKITPLAQAEKLHYEAKKARRIKSYANIGVPQVSDSELGLTYNTGISYHGRVLTTDIQFARDLYRYTSLTLSELEHAITSDRNMLFQLGHIHPLSNNRRGHFQFNFGRHALLNHGSNFNAGNYSHQAAQSVMIGSSYGLLSSRDQRTIFDMYIGLGLRRAVDIQTNLGVQEDQTETLLNDLIPKPDIGRQSFVSERVASFSTQAMVGVQVWPDIIDGVLDMNMEVYKFNTSMLVIDNGFESNKTEYASIISKNKLAFEFVFLDNIGFIPQAFVKLDTFTVSSENMFASLSNPKTTTITPIYGIGVYRGQRTLKW